MDEHFIPDEIKIRVEDQNHNPVNGLSLYLSFLMSYKNNHGNIVFSSNKDDVFNYLITRDEIIEKSDKNLRFALMDYKAVEDSYYLQGK